MQLLDRALSAPFTDLLATVDDPPAEVAPAAPARDAVARARYNAMAAQIDAAQTVPAAARRPRRRTDGRRGRRTG